jgi:hypothetical protein
VSAPAVAMRPLSDQQLPPLQAASRKGSSIGVAASAHSAGLSPPVKGSLDAALSTASTQPDASSQDGSEVKDSTTPGGMPSGGGGVGIDDVTAALRASLQLGTSVFGVGGHGAAGQDAGPRSQTDDAAQAATQGCDDSTTARKGGTFVHGVGGAPEVGCSVMLGRTSSGSAEPLAAGPLVAVPCAADRVRSAAEDARASDDGFFGSVSWPPEGGRSNDSHVLALSSRYSTQKTEVFVDPMRHYKQATDDPCGIAGQAAPLGEGTSSVAPAARSGCAQTGKAAAVAGTLHDAPLEDVESVGSGVAPTVAIAGTSAAACPSPSPAARHSADTGRSSAPSSAACAECQTVAVVPPEPAKCLTVAPATCQSAKGGADTIADENRAETVIAVLPVDTFSKESRPSPPLTEWGPPVGVTACSAVPAGQAMSECKTLVASDALACPDLWGREKQEVREGRVLDGSSSPSPRSPSDAPPQERVDTGTLAEGHGSGHLAAVAASSTALSGQARGTAPQGGAGQASQCPQSEATGSTQHDGTVPDGKYATGKYATGNGLALLETDARGGSRENESAEVDEVLAVGVSPRMLGIFQEQESAEVEQCAARTLEAYLPEMDIDLELRLLSTHASSCLVEGALRPGHLFVCPV